MGGDKGATRAMTYAALADALGIEVESARRLSQRHRWHKETGADGRARVAVPVAFLAARERAPRHGGDTGRDKGGDMGGDMAELIGRIVARFRVDPGFADRLETLLADAAADPLADRLAEVERRLAALEARIEEPTVPEVEPVPEVEHVPPVAVAEEPEPAPVTEASPSPVGEPPAASAVEEPLVTGEGRQRRLTPAGEREVERRLAEGQGDAEIASALGVARNSVANRRRRRAERQG